MIRKIIRFINSIFVNNFKFLIIKIFFLKRFKFKMNNIISPLNTIDIQDKGQIIFGERLIIPSKSTFGVRDSGILEINDGTFINNNCQIIAHKRIRIGKNVCIGPNVVIVDHDHEFGENGVQKKKFNSKDIIINNGAWIGANCIILKGSKIGKNAVIGAGTIVNYNVPDNTILVQKRENVFSEIK